MLKKKNISKYLLIVFGSIFIVYILYWLDKPKSLTGEWFAIGSPYSDQNHWSIDDSLNLLMNTNIFSKSYFDTLHIVVSDSNTYELRSNENYRDEIGFITEYKKDTVRFSTGLELIRISPTKTEYDLLPFQELLLNSIIELSFNFKVRLNRFEMFDSYEMKARLFPNDTLPTNLRLRWGDTYRADEYGIITNISGNNDVGTNEFTGDYVNLKKKWGVYSINGLFIMQYDYHHYLDTSYLIHEVSDSGFSGSVYYRGQLVPFSATVKPIISDKEKNSIQNFLVDTHWKTEVNKFNEMHGYSEDVWTYDKRTRAFLENDPDQLVIIGKENDIISNSITFRFTEDGELQIYSLGGHTNTMKWKVSEDGEFLFIYMHDHRLTFTTHIALEWSNERISKLKFDIPIYLDQPDSSIILKDVHFELVPE